MNRKESNSKETENNDTEHFELDKESLDATTSESDDFIEISTKEHYIQKYRINPAETPIIISYNAYRRIVGYAMRYGNDELPQ
ncbi:MAG: hypothetical protein KGD70_03800, partial [Candidatus Lokiarchaeota archaeon]|nr:hypothetical protein [Candidatus Lokiarchaeota archaeon]